MSDYFKLKRPFATKTKNLPDNKFKKLAELFKTTEEILLVTLNVCKNVKMAAKELSIVEDKKLKTTDEKKLKKLEEEHNEIIKKLNRYFEKSGFAMFAATVLSAKTPEESIDILNSVIEKETMSSFVEYLSNMRDNILKQMKQE